MNARQIKLVRIVYKNGALKKEQITANKVFIIYLLNMNYQVWSELQRCIILEGSYVH